jgi:raffinose/stachyose/melibiose transport system permease protein
MGSRFSKSSGYAPFLAPGLVLFALVILAPFATNLGISLTKWNGVGKPVWIGLANYARAFGDAVFWASFRNNLILIFAVTIIPTIVGLTLADFLFEYVAPRAGSGAASFFRGGFYLPQVLPVAIAGVVWGWILDPQYGVLDWTLKAVGLGGLARNWLGDAATALPSVMFIMVWFQIGYPLVIFMSALQRIDPEIMEAAEVDGASWRRRFGIVAHLVVPEILVVVLTTTIYALKLFGQIYVLTRGGPGNATIVPSYFAYQNFFEKARVGYGSAISTLMTLIIIALTIAFINVQARQEREMAL